FLAIFKSLLDKPYKSLSIVSIIFSFSIILVFVICRVIPFDPARIAWDSRQILYIFLYSFFLSIPFFFSGLIISIAISHAPRVVNKTYFSDMIGAGLGALSVSILFSYLEGSGVIVLASLIAGLGSLFFSLKEKTYIPLKIIWIFLILHLLIVKPQNIINYINITISPYKDLKVALLPPESRLLKTSWNAFSRVDAVSSPAVRYAPGLSLEYRGTLPSQIGLTVDGSGLNAITEYRNNPPSPPLKSPSIPPLLKGEEGGLTDDLGFIQYLPSFLPYYLKLKTHDSELRTQVLIIEPGGGLPVLMTLKGFPSPQSSPKGGEGGEGVFIDIVERNPLIVKFVRDDFGKFSGDIYKDNRVKVWIEEGRTFLKKVKKKYDIIDLSKTGTISPTSTGIYGLLEDYTFTVDAFEEYIQSLREDGFISITRYLLPPPREEVRIASLIMDAFRRTGVHDPSDRIAAIRTWGTITILIKKSPFNAVELDRIREFSQSRRFDIVYLKGLRPDETNIYNIFKEDIYFRVFGELLDPQKRAGFYEDYLFDLTPTTDDRPFFFQFFKIRKFMPTYHSMKDKWQPFIEGGYIVPVILIESLVLSFLLILLPLSWMKREKVEGRRGQRLKIILYFISIGLGFMFIEIVMIQKFILFLGKPVYSVSLVLFSILLSTAAGSYFSKRGETVDVGVLRKRIKIAITSIFFILITYYFLLDKLLLYSLGNDFVIRIFITFSLLFPLGFFMGFPFPLGIRAADLCDKRLIPWAWAANGCASVVATSLSIMLAITFGFSSVLLMAGGIYLLGAITLFVTVE
ncbi:MAG: hypothetical protein AABY44_03105, partial [Nitrospirota bacterium]